MKPILDNFKGSDKENPFKDSQARSFSNNKLVSEFCPTSFFWSLFNDQHEILVGTRGSGKTILLRMMQYSLLKNIDDAEAKKIIKEKKYIALYVPTNIEFLRSINPLNLSYESQISFFQFGFNCFIAQTFLVEIESIINNNKPDFIQQSILKENIIRIVSKMWFPNDDDSKSFEELSFKIDNQYHNFNFHLESDLSNLPQVFTKTIGSPIQSISKHIYKYLEMVDEPTWLLCIDEADFFGIPHQKCINSLFRAHSQGIVIKMATLPFRHITRETSVEGEYAEPHGNDFNYRKIEFDPDGDEFEKITNSLCKNRILKVINNNIIEEITLSNLVGIEGGDHQIDYYKKEINDESLDRNRIEEAIINQLSYSRKERALKNGIGSKENRKTVYDKFAPIFFVREMFKLSKRGSRIPGYYAGANIIRKVSEGNPRIFIQIMSQMFEEARKTNLTPKKQHQVLMNYAIQQCEITERLPDYGLKLSNFLKGICTYIQEQTHNNELKDTGNDFLISEDVLKLTDMIDSLKLGCAYSRLKIDENSLLTEISNDSEFTLSNLYALKYWIPMRKAGNLLNWNLEKQKNSSLKDSDIYQAEIKFE